ncbi:MAG: adenylate/guanylate cyclase domain-containing protein [Candidatus Baltobacteraceae bacterium]
MALKAPLPSGTVTLLFTDIEGSTQHWEQQRTAMAEALRRHDELLRTAIEENGGHVFKTVGDAVCSAFSRPSDAVSAAAEAQGALAAEDWSAVGGLAVRMALHTGTTDERDGDYFGPTVNRVARLMSVAHGGQVVVSGATALLLRGMLPEQAELRDLGEHRLKDLVEPERVWQLFAPGLLESFPPLQSLDSLPNNLPHQIAPLIGRDDVLAEVERLVLEQPLVTLVGTGGIGKTRLALQVGADHLDRVSDGVWLVELATVSDAASVVNAVAATLGLREQGGRPMLEVLVRYLKSRCLLLILDNCEHLIEEVARITDAILRAAPQVRVLATSREPLRIAAEHVYRVPSLAVPSRDSLTAGDALGYGAVALFAERARAADATFTLTEENAPIVADICRRLDGIALAIELAAARVKVMAPRQLAQKLDERFRVLTGGSRTALPRQQTMRALIDWSYDLLTEQEQRLFRRVSIFIGGWTLEAAEAVCTDDTLDALDAIDLISSLVEKSLVVADVEADSTRYRLLESTGAFAHEKLERSGERDVLARRHAQWAADLADRSYEARWSTGLTARWYAEFEPEAENARSATDWALSHDEVVLAARLVVGFSSTYRRLVGEAETKGRIEAVIERLDAGAQPELAARAWAALSRTIGGSRRIEAAQRAIDLGERSNDAANTTQSLCEMAFGLMQAGRTQEAYDAIERAMQLLKESGLTRSATHGSVLNNGAMVANDCGRLDEARQLYAEALALSTSLGDEEAATGIRLNLAELEFQMGNSERALELASGIEPATRGSRIKRYVIFALQNGAAYRLALGDVAGARAAALESLRLSRGVSVQPVIINIQHLATVASRSGDPHRGARLRGYVDAWYRGEGYEREPSEQCTYDILMTALSEQLSQPEIEAFAAEGALLSEDQAVAEAQQA